MNIIEICTIVPTALIGISINTCSKWVPKNKVKGTCKMLAFFVFNVDENCTELHPCLSLALFYNITLYANDISSYIMQEQ